jgi:aspartate/methionine/tyrosine aminotransferase
MAGWRIGMVAGDAEAITQVLKVKSQMDSGMFKALQLAAVEALGQGPEWFTELNAEYKARRDVVCRIFDLLGAKFDRDSSGLFVWGDISASPVLAKLTVPEGMTLGEAMSEKFLHEAGVFITPGFIFGKNGRNFVRISLCAPVPVLEDAERKIKAAI